MSSENLRQQVVRQAKLIVVKVGSDVLAKTSEKSGSHDAEVIRQLAENIANLHGRGIKVVLVSSGAIGRGMSELGRSSRPKRIEQLQAAAAVGQPHLMRLYETALAKHGLKVGQILLTRSDFEDRTRYLNIRRTIDALHKMKAVPVINENDTVAVEEIRFGENDILAGLVVNLLRADLLIFLSTVDGLLKDKNVVDVVEEIDQSVYSLDHGRQSQGGLGGIKSKLEAVELVSKAGETAIIANGKLPNILSKLMAGEKLGTLFLPSKKKISARKRWIGSAAKATGRLIVDSGAAEAIQKSRKSLLAIGIKDVRGNFRVGEVVEILSQDGKQITKGRVNYSAAKIRKIMGLKSSQIKAVLGESGQAEVIHADNLAL